ncbi:MAG TPA: hypothetical protein VFU63_06145, partial [Ktedonobacterales bacterium]|nr:hypothetical protein [Ktedonobacterales bacterium]
ATTPTRQYPQVEEGHPTVQEDEQPSAPAPNVGEPEIPGATEVTETVIVAENEEIIDIAAAPDVSTTAETPEGAPGPADEAIVRAADEPGRKPAQKSASKPARRASSASLSAPANTPRKRNVSGASSDVSAESAGDQPTQQTARQARTKSQASAARKTASREPGAKKTSGSASPGKSDMRKQARTPRNTD